MTFQPLHFRKTLVQTGLARTFRGLLVLVLLVAFESCDDPASPPPPGNQTPSLAAPDTSWTGNYILWWTTPQNATSYLVQEDQTPAFDSPVEFYTGVDTIIRATGKTFGSAFYYRVQANNATGSSDWSDTRSVVVIQGDYPEIRTADTVDFGTVVLDSSSGVHTICITNIGSRPLEITGISWTQNPTFSVSLPSSYPISVGSGGSFCLAGIVFRPTEPGLQEETITVFSNDLDDFPPKIILHGIGELGMPVISVQPDTMNFEVYSETGFADQVLSIGNDGAEPLMVAGVTFDDPRFSVVGIASFTVAPASVESVTVRMTESIPGAYSANLTISSNDPVNPELNVHVSATVYREIIFAAVGNSTVFRSIDEGVSWKASSNGISYPAITLLRLWFIDDDKTLLATVGNDDGVYSSTDAGANWIKRSIAPSTVSGIAANSTGRLYACSSGGVFLSDDNGATWSHIVLDLFSEAIAVNSLDHVFAGHRSGLMRSTDDGTTWTEVFHSPNDFDVTSIAIGSNDELVIGVPGSGAYRSTNNGFSWIPIDVLSTFPGIFGRGTNFLFSRTENGCFRSGNGGISWISMPMLTDPQTYFGFGPYEELFAGTRYGEVYRSTDEGLSWVLVNSGID